MLSPRNIRTTQTKTRIERSKTISTPLKISMSPFGTPSRNYEVASTFGELIEIQDNGKTIEGHFFILNKKKHIYLEFEPMDEFPFEEARTPNLSPSPSITPNVLSSHSSNVSSFQPIHFKSNENSPTHSSGHLNQNVQSIQTSNLSSSSDKIQQTSSAVNVTHLSSSSDKSIPISSSIQINQTQQNTNIGNNANKIVQPIPMNQVNQYNQYKSYDPKQKPHYYIWCLEDTPSYNQTKRMYSYEIVFQKGRDMNVTLPTFIFRKEIFNLFLEALEKNKVTMSNGYIRFEKKKGPCMIDIDKYLKEINYDSHMIKRTNWINQIRADSTKKIDGSIEWNTMNAIKLRKALFYKGVSEELRCEMWKKCLGVNFKEELYNKLKMQYSLLFEEQINNCEGIRNAFEQIEKDMNRTYVTKRCLSHWNMNQQELKEIMERILKCWIIYNIDAGYQQGMSDIVIGIMEYSNIEYEVFGMFIKIIDLMKCVYLQQGNADKYCSAILRHVDPELHSYFKMMNISYSFMYKWIVLLFRREFTEEKCVRIWDAIFAFPENRLYFFIAISMLEQHKDVILQNRFDLDDISIFVQQMENKFEDQIYIDADIIAAQFRMDATDEEQMLLFN